MSENALTVTIAGRAEDIEVSAFMAIVKNTVALLLDIEALESKGAPRLRWVITHLSKSSPAKLRMAGVEDRPIGGAPSTPSTRVVEPFLRSMRELEEGKRRPEGFSDTMLDRATYIVRPLNGSVARVVYSSDDAKNVVPVSQHISANVDKFRLPENYAEFGELEGELGQITVHKPPYEFCIYDPLTDRKIPCRFDPDDLVQIKDHLKERIRASGLITYRRRDDLPLSVTVDDWTPLPGDADLPSIEELHAAGIDITGGRSSQEVVAEIRGRHA